MKQEAVSRPDGFETVFVISQTCRIPPFQILSHETYLFQSLQSRLNLPTNQTFCFVRNKILAKASCKIAQFPKRTEWAIL
ncbi:hypothetical protein EII14_01105 [Alloprevotella sp. OH1205_COT-284]|uniref:hypothetical protein n=1 Tax=Alloprevotella sp. OH1205_COT-284 TaxID=2491043 RepID=UPI000F5F21FF|nr:hypothetical protein [Alloprevotella sp. OH1205_COT-284]RRD80628.1 hypothetical protein EII14_01105 [Alloprevotella sp. OH1205_COT-284]